MEKNVEGHLKRKKRKVRKRRRNNYG